jgi:CheY-like chemotaxis protein
MVDDSEVALRALGRQLEALGLRTDGCANSTLALQALAQSRYDLLLVDVDLGEHSDLDGLALCRQVKHQRHPNGRPPVVVMVSAHVAPVDLVRGTLAGCDAYLAKPLDGAELLHALQRHGIRPASAAVAGG